MTDKFSQFYSQMQDSDNYLKMEELKDGYGYKICARNAYVGVWIERERGFLISRYKAGPIPRLFVEYHWDTWTPDDPTGTVKPLEVIEQFPFELLDHNHDYTENETTLILEYLDNLEEENPIIEGFNYLQDRKMSAIQFGERLRKRKHRIRDASTEKIKKGMRCENKRITKRRGSWRTNECPSGQIIRRPTTASGCGSGIGIKTQICFGR